MYLGKLCEIGAARVVYDRPAHPYTEALLASVPVPDPAHELTAPTLSPVMPSPVNPPSGCRFRTRCWKAQDICAVEEPELKPRAGGAHPVACHFAEVMKPLDIVGQAAAS